MNYPPPYMDIATLAEHICLSEGTIEQWVRFGLLPAPRKRGGRRLWKWAQVEAYLDDAREVASAGQQANRITEATKAALAGR